MRGGNLQVIQPKSADQVTVGPLSCCAVYNCMPLACLVARSLLAATGRSKLIPFPYLRIL